MTAINAPTDLVGQTLGPYTLERLLGRPVAVAEAEDALARHFAEVFQRELLRQ